jgi:hypothetical protein
VAVLDPNAQSLPSSWNNAPPFLSTRLEIPTDIILIIHGPLAETLCQELVGAGLSAIAPSAKRDAEALYLGALALPLVTPLHPLRLRSPILARGPISHYTIEILSTPAADPSDAD